ncbi:MAG: MBL fold metallo-hydrolase [Clostridia bacterium]
MKSKRKSTHLSKNKIILIVTIAVLVVAIMVTLTLSNQINSLFGVNVESPATTTTTNNTSEFIDGYVNKLPSEFDVNSLLEVHFVNIGQGDAIVINCPDDKTILIDAGSVTTGISEIETNYMNYLDIITDDKIIDYLIVTHPHTDHYNMLDKVLENYDVKEIYYNENEEEKVGYGNFIEESKEEPSIVIHEVDHESLFATITGTNYTLDIYACGDNAFTNADEPNCMSIICLLTYANRQILFTGDAETTTEEWFMQKYGNDEDIDIDILKVGHHGSDSSTSSEFLDYLEPEYAIISCDDGTKYGHPHQVTMDKLNAYGIVTYRTNIHGNILLFLDGDGDFGFLTQNPEDTQNNSKNIDAKQIKITA